MSSTSDVKASSPFAAADLSAVVASATDAIVTADAAGRILGWNPAAGRIFGYPAEEVVGRPLTILIPETYREAHEAGIARVVETGETRVIGRTVELTGLRRDGSEFPVELSLSTWTEDGRRFFAGILRDVSERARLLRDLSDSTERLQAVLDTATDAVICADRDGRIQLWNPAAERILGHASEEMLGEPLTRIVPERYREAHQAGIARMGAGGEPRIIGKTVEVAALRADGTEIPVELSLSTWTTEGGRFYAGILRDVSERKRAEETLREAQEALREKNQELEALSSKLAKYLSRQLYDSIFEGRTDVRVTSYRKELTIFFSDIQGFTELTDTMEAEPLSHLLNEYLGEMSAIAERHGGTVDKFIGDGIMIFFGDPESQGRETDALACVEMALAMRSRVQELQDDWADRGVPRSLHVRMGINTGYVTVGNFGSEDRLDYTIVGGQVNAAARLEEAAGPDEILVSGETHALVKERFLCEPVGELKVKGIAYPIGSYRVIAARARGRPDREILRARHAGFRLALDPTLLAAEDVAAAREVLRRALRSLEPGGEPPADGARGRPGRRGGRAGAAGRDDG
jgi:PAS domain S-box-containing protein